MNFLTWENAPPEAKWALEEWLPSLQLPELPQMCIRDSCPPAVGSLEECGKRIHSYPNGILFSSVADVSDVMNMAEMLATRDAHEELTTEVAGFLKGEGFETFTLSTESCDL